MKTDTYVEFIQEWAKKAWDLDGDFVGTMSGGIDPPKHMINCVVVGNSTVEIGYDYPETAGLSDVRYHVTDPHRIRHDEFMFTDDGQIIMNGVPFPGSQYKDDPWTEKEANEFEKEYAEAFEELRLKTQADFDEAMRQRSKEPEHMSSIMKRVVDDLRKKVDDNMQEDELEEPIPSKKKHEKKPEKQPKSKPFDTANYTKSLQLASEAETGIKFNGGGHMAEEYDNRDNNPADVMAGWDDYNETIHDRAQQERDLQHLVNDKGLYTNHDEPDMSGAEISEEINESHKQTLEL